MIQFFARVVELREEKTVIYDGKITVDLPSRGFLEVPNNLSLLTDFPENAVYIGESPSKGGRIMQDNDIIALYFERNQDAIRHTQNKYGSYCHSVSMNILNSRSDAEECVNDTWVRAWNAIPPHRPSVLRTFLGKITRNLSINRLKDIHRQKRNPDLLLSFDELSECISLPEDTTDTQLCAYLNQFLSVTDPFDRQLFVGRYWYGRSVGNMAKHHGLTSNAVSQRLKRTRQKLKAFLEERGYSV